MGGSDPGAEPSDESLVRRVRAGDESAARRLFERHAKVKDRFGFDDVRPQAASIGSKIHREFRTVELACRFIAGKIARSKSFAPQRLR